PPLPSSPVEIAEKNGTALRLSLIDVTKLALQNNLDIAISDTNEEIYQQKIRGAYGPYDPTLTITYAYSQSRRANTNFVNAAAGFPYNQSNQNRLTFFQYQQALPTGGDISATANWSRGTTNSDFQLLDPSYSSTPLFRFTQPLLRNFRIDQNRGNIKIANLDLKINDSTFKQKVVDTVARIQALYWDLVNAIRDYEIRRESVKLAQITLQNNRKKVEIGTLAPIGITEAEAELANREVDLIAAEERINNVQNNLKALISNDRRAEIWRQTIVPTETAEFRDYKVDLEVAISTALANRPELEQLDIRLEQTDINYNVNKNRKKWQFDLVADVGLQGVSGPQSFRNGIPQVAQSIVGGPFQAFKVLLSEGFYNWSVGFNLQIPLGNRALESQLAQLNVQRRQNLMNRRVLEQQIQVEIRNAVQAVETSKKRVETARVARQLAEEQLVGEEKRFQAGLSENFRVLDRQRGLSSAQGVELQALITYKKAIIGLQTAMYTLLESNDFEIAKGSSQGVPGLQ
ncbi:MAG: TolC family protein, partial [Acidobacteria bacterium]|nr:TolC family protein [Acidobacteriota bacterium]